MKTKARGLPVLFQVYIRAWKIQAKSRNRIRVGRSRGRCLNHKANEAVTERERERERERGRGGGERERGREKERGREEGRDRGRE